MARKYHLGAIGFAHMHVSALLDQFAKLPNVEWVVCADTVPAVPSRRSPCPIHPLSPAWCTAKTPSQR